MNNRWIWRGHTPAGERKSIRGLWALIQTLTHTLLSSVQWINQTRGADEGSVTAGKVYMLIRYGFYSNRVCMAHAPLRMDSLKEGVSSVRVTLCVCVCMMERHTDFRTLNIMSFCVFTLFSLFVELFTIITKQMYPCMYIYIPEPPSYKPIFQ